MAFSKKRISLLQKKLAFFNEKAETIQDHMRELLLGVEELKSSSL